MKSQLLIYYFFVFISFIYLLYKFRSNSFYILTVFIFNNGLFAFFGKDIWNIYKILLLVMSVFFVYKYKLFTIPKTILLKVAFFLFTLVFVLSAIVNNDYFLIIFSQFSRYFIAFVVVLFVYKFRDNETFSSEITLLIFNVLSVQVFLSIIKFITMGPTESYVGSVSEQGGAMATSLPMLGFIYVWLRKKGQLSGKDWIFIAGLMFIGFVSLKRAIWFIMPVLFALFLVYVPGKRLTSRMLLFGTLGTFIIFYLGVRFNPTLNKEKIIGGSFDLNYVVDYARNYNFGEDDSDKTSGRGNAALFIYEKVTSFSIREEEWLGYGLRYMFATDYEEFAELDLNITNKGSATGIFQTLVSNGFLGILATLFFSLSMLSFTRNPRITIVLLGLFLWEYIFYTGVILREPSLSFLLIYVIIFSPVSLNREKVYQKI